MATIESEKCNSDSDYDDSEDSDEEEPIINVDTFEVKQGKRCVDHTLALVLKNALNSKNTPNQYKILINKIAAIVRKVIILKYFN